MNRKQVNGCGFYLILLLELYLIIFLGITYFIVRYVDLKYILISFLITLVALVITLSLKLIYKFKISEEVKNDESIGEYDEYDE